MGQTRFNKTHGAVGNVGKRVYKAILSAQLHGSDVCDLVHRSAYEAVAHLVDETGVPRPATWREYSGRLRSLKREIDLGEHAGTKQMLYNRLTNHLKKNRTRAGRDVAPSTDSSGSLDEIVDRRFGYTLDALMRHMAGLFTDGMTWERFARGDVQMDHRVPAAVFNLSNPEGVRRAYALDNLQPLWRGDNARKGRLADRDWVNIFGEGTIDG